MLPNNESVSLLSSYLLDWCVCAGVAPGLVYRQLKYLKNNIVDTPLGGCLGAESLASRGSVSNLSQQGQVFLNGLLPILYEPVGIVVRHALQLRYGKVLFSRVVKAFALKIGVRKVRLYIAYEITNEQVLSVSSAIDSIFDSKVDLILKVDKNLLNGWTLFVDFMKIDRSARGILDGVLKSLNLVDYDKSA